MEGIIEESLTDSWEVNHVLCTEQQGFRQGRSCLTNLLESYEKWTRTLDECQELDIVFLDYC